MLKILLTRSTITLSPKYLRQFIAILFLFGLCTGGMLAQESMVAYKGLSYDFDFKESELGYNCSALNIIPASLSKIRDRECSYRLEFEELGLMTCKILIADSLISDYKFVVVELPELEHSFGGEKGGKISSDDFLALSQMQVESEWEIPYEVKVKSFVIEIVRGKKKLFSSLNMRDKYNTSVQNMIKAIKSNDRIYFKKIEVQIGEFNVFYLDDLEFRIQ